METRVAVMSIIVEKEETVEALNRILHDYGGYIIGRMGIPLPAAGDQHHQHRGGRPQDTISALSGKVGKLSGVSVKTAFSHVISMDKSVQNLIDRLVREHSLSLEGYETLLRRRTPPPLPGWPGRRLPSAGRSTATLPMSGASLRSATSVKTTASTAVSAGATPHCDRYRLSPPGDFGLLPGGLRLGLSHLCAPGRRGWLFHRPSPLPLIQEIKARWPDCAVTLSLGERAGRVTSASSTPAPTGISCATRRRTRTTTDVFIHPPCPSNGGWNV